MTTIADKTYIAFHKVSILCQQDILNLISGHLMETIYHSVALYQSLNHALKQYCTDIKL